MSKNKKLATTTSKGGHDYLEYTMYSTVSTQYLRAMLDCNSPARQSLLQWKLTVVSVYLTLTFLHKMQ